MRKASAPGLACLPVDRLLRGHRRGNHAGAIKMVKMRGRRVRQRRAVGRARRGAAL